MVSGLRDQATSRNFGLKFIDYPMKEPFDAKWIAQVRKRIALTSATIVMIGEHTASSPAVDFEIEESYGQGKKVIGVRINRDAIHPIPDTMKKHDAPIVNWTLFDIQRELDNYEKNLFVNLQDTFKDDYYPTLLEQYKIYVQIADNTIERINKTNTFFLSINSFLLTLLGIFTKLQSGNNASWWIMILSSAGGVTFAVAWLMLIQNYRKQLRDKFKVIREIELRLPIAPYTREFGITFKREKHDRYSKMMTFESIIPIVFVILYAILSVVWTSLFDRLFIYNIIIFYP